MIQLSLFSLSSLVVVVISPVIELMVNLSSATPSAITYVNAVLSAVNTHYVTVSVVVLTGSSHVSHIICRKLTFYSFTHYWTVFIGLFKLIGFLL